MFFLYRGNSDYIGMFFEKIRLVFLSFFYSFSSIFFLQEEPIEPEKKPRFSLIHSRFRNEAWGRVFVTRECTKISTCITCNTMDILSGSIFTAALASVEN